jgi:membrane protease YdiL (CAAX protease family)
MPDAPDDRVELYRARGADEAHALAAELFEAGVPARVENELLQGAVGEVPAGWATAPRVLVARRHLNAARAALDDFLAGAGPATPDAEPGELRCLACRAPMGSADVCPDCGWSYVPDPIAGPAPAEQPAARESAPAEPEIPTPMPPPGPPNTATWGELIAVLCVGVVPHCLAVVPAPPRELAPYWADSVYLTVSSISIAFVTLYLIHRGGEPWARFGLGPVTPADLFIGFALFLAAEVLWLTEQALGVDVPIRKFFPLPAVPADYVMMGVKHAANGFTEELVTRAYLITRLEVLLGSRVWAVFWAAVAFTSYHAYQGPSALFGIFILGVVYGVAYLAVRRVWPLALGHALTNIYGESTP